MPLSLSQRDFPSTVGAEALPTTQISPRSLLVRLKPAAKWLTTRVGAGQMKARQAYLLALLVTVATFLVRFAIDDSLGHHPTLLIFILPIMVSAYFGGWSAGFFATAVSLLGASYYLLPPLQSFQVASSAERWQQAFVAGTGMAISLLNERLHQSRRRAELATAEHLRAEKRAQRNEKRSRDLIDGLGPSMFVALLTTEGILLEVNQAPLLAAGLQAEDVLGKPFAETHWWNHSPIVQAQLREAIVKAAQGEASRYDVRTQGAGGEVIDIDFCLQPLRDETGAVAFLVPSASVITERKQMENALQESAAQFRDLADLMPQIVWTAQPDGYVDYYNRRWHDFTGRPEGMLGDASWQEVLHPDDLERCSALWSASMKTGAPYLIEYRFRSDETGLYRWHLGRALPVRDGAGKIVRWFGTATDIDDLKTAQAELVEAQQTLEQRVETRTAQLAASNRDLESFSYSVSHDLRAPLRAISGFSRILLEDYADSLDPDGLRYLQQVQDGGLQMGRLIDDLLTFSRTGRHALQLQQVDVSGMVRGCLAELKLQEPDHGAQIRVGELGSCEADPALLKQLWLNLLSNALKYSRKSEHPVITIGRRREGAEDVYFVEDNGAGFDMKYVDKLFHVFQRLHLAEDYEGTGVGLALVQRIVERHGGRVWAEGAVNRGAKFSFTLTGKADDV